MEVWNKFNPRERTTALGALVVVVGWILGLVSSFGFGSNTVALLGAVAVLVVLYLKYAPSQNITWPAPVPLIVLAVSAITALLAAISLLQWLSILGAFASFFGLYMISVIVIAVGAGLMVLGAWREYQLAPKPAGPASTGSAAPTAPAPPPAAMTPPAEPPPAATAAPPPAATPPLPPVTQPPPVPPEDEDRPPA